MLATSVERRFYQAFFRWNNALKSSKHPAHYIRRPFSLSISRRTDDDKPSSPDGTDLFIRVEDPPLASFRGGNVETPESASVDEDAPPEGSRNVSEELHRGLRLKTLVRNVFCSVAHPVAVVTALAEGEEGGSDEDAAFSGTSITNAFEEALDRLRAMTVSSLNTVSLDPEPIISFNIRTPSSTWDAIQANPRFRVHLLRSTERAREIALSFARGETRAGFIRQMAMGMSVNLNRPGGVFRLNSKGTEWNVLEGNVDPNPAPFLKTKAVACCLLCRLLPEKCVQVNDHVIVVAGVEQVLNVRPSFWATPKKPRTPTLSYFNHEFVRVDRPVTATHMSDPRSTSVVYPVEPNYQDGKNGGNNQGSSGVQNVLRLVKSTRKAPKIRNIEV